MKTKVVALAKKKKPTQPVLAEQVVNTSMIDKSKGDESSEKEETEPVKKRKIRVKYNPKS